MRKVVLKLSGEVLSGGKGFAVDDEFLSVLAGVIGKVRQQNIGIAIVIGAGNFWRGRQTTKMNKSYADHMGMLATVMNSVALSDALNQQNIPNRHFTAMTIEGIGERYNVSEAELALKSGQVIIISGGTGSPFFTTDSGAALRACELGATEILLAKKVDAVYDKDPNMYSDAIKFDNITYDEIFEKKLGVIDLTAAIMCMENGVNLRVFALEDPENIIRAAKGENIGTTVSL